MRIHILGSAAGGGFPQWNCNCPYCQGVRQGTITAQARSQSSVAITTNDHQWLLINASPDIRSQIESLPTLQPSKGVRTSGIGAVLLMDSQVDHTGGLMFLRENSTPLDLYCTKPVYEDLTSGFNILSTLGHYCGVETHLIDEWDRPFEVPFLDGVLLSALPIKSDAPPYSPSRHRPRTGHTIALKIRDQRTGRTALYAPSLGRGDDLLRRHVEACDCLLVDGTFWHEDDMRRAGCGDKTAAAMGHLPLYGPKGLMEWLRPIDVARKILIHINNTNPILDERSDENEMAKKAGFEIAHDGLDVFL